MFKNILEAQDYFGQNLQFKFNGKDKFKTPFGILISVIINLLCLSLLINLSFELLGRSNPYVNAVNLRENLSPNMTLNTEDFFFGIRIADKYFSVIRDPSIVQFNPQYSLTIANETGIYSANIPIQTTNCSEYFYMFEKYNMTADYYANDFPYAYCLNRTNFGTDMVLGGKFGSPFYGNLDLTFNKCKNNTKSNITCKSAEEIDEALSGAWLEIASINRYIDIYDFEKPIKQFVDSFYNVIDPKLTKVMYAYYNNVIVNTDRGFIFTEKKDESSFQSDYMFNDINMLNTDETVYHVYILSSFSKHIFYRQYMKLQNLLASVGGILKSLLLIGTIITTHINQAKMYESIINNLFEFTAPKDVTIFHKNTIEENRKFQVSYSDYLRMKIPCFRSKMPTKKFHFLRNVSDETDKYLDYVDNLRSFQDIIKLKLILLNDHQQRLFENMKFKWMIDTGLMDNSNLKLKFAKNKKFTIREITESYNVCITNPKNEINKKILEFLK
jgi:hypothetical protein